MNRLYHVVLHFIANRANHLLFKVLNEDNERRTSEQLYFFGFGAQTKLMSLLNPEDRLKSDS